MKVKKYQDEIKEVEWEKKESRSKDQQIQELLDELEYKDQRITELEKLVVNNDE